METIASEEKTIVSRSQTMLLSMPLFIMKLHYGAIIRGLVFCPQPEYCICSSPSRSILKHIFAFASTSYFSRIPSEPSRCWYSSLYRFFDCISACTLCIDHYLSCRVALCLYYYITASAQTLCVNSLVFPGVTG